MATRLRVPNVSFTRPVIDRGPELYASARSHIARVGTGPSNVDIINRENLDNMLSSSKWAHIGELWDGQTRQELNLVWHRLKGWPDVVDGLTALKKKAIIATLSNGNVRLLVDMAKAANLPWDIIFSTELFGTFKPNPKAYRKPYYICLSQLLIVPWSQLIFTI